MWPQLLSPRLDCSLEAQPKYVKGGKRYGRRSLPEFQESVEEFAEIEPLDGEARPSHTPAGDRNEVRSWTGAPSPASGGDIPTHSHGGGVGTGELGGGGVMASVTNHWLILLLAFGIYMADLSIVWTFLFLFLLES